jgi:uncharacterized coiled-coil DUF342 family protein
MNTNFRANLYANMGALKAKMVVLRDQAERADDTSHALWKRVQELEADKLATNEELDRAYDEYEEALDAYHYACECYDICEEMHKNLFDTVAMLEQSVEWYGLNLGE